MGKHLAIGFPQTEIPDGYGLVAAATRPRPIAYIYNKTMQLLVSETQA